jgi:hypothetical protein
MATLLDIDNKDPTAYITCHCVAEMMEAEPGLKTWRWAETGLPKASGPQLRLAHGYRIISTCLATVL